MKRIVLISVFAALALSFTSCVNRTLPARFEKFVDKVEVKYKTYTDEQWDDVLLQFNKLDAKFEEAQKKDKLTAGSIDRINKAEGRFYKVYVKHGVSDFVDVDKLDETYQNVKEKFKKGIESILEDIKEWSDE